MGEAKWTASVTGFVLWVLCVQGFSGVVDVPSFDEFHGCGAAGLGASGEVSDIWGHYQGDSFVCQVFEGGGVAFVDDW